MILSDRESFQEWPGLKSQKFTGGRLHLKPADEIGTVIQGKDLKIKQKKHFQEVFSAEYAQKNHIKLFEQKNKETYTIGQDSVQQKLQYLPPQRKAKMDALEQMGQQRRTSEKDKFHRRIGMMTLRSYNKYQEQQTLKLEQERTQQLQQQKIMNQIEQQQLQNQHNVQDFSIRSKSQNGSKFNIQQLEQLEEANEERRIIYDLENWANDKIYEPKYGTLNSNNNNSNVGTKPETRESQRSMGSRLSNKQSVQSKSQRSFGNPNQYYE